MTARETVLVGVDGSAASGSAVRWAAAEAAATGRRVRLVHVGDVLGVGTGPGGPPGRTMLDDAAATARAEHPALEVSSQLITGDPATELIALGRAAAVLVVGRGRRTLPGLFLGSVASHVLARSHRPAAVVAPGERVAADVVAVGVSDSAGGAAALRFAFDEAALRGAEVLAVRSWSERDWRFGAGTRFPLTPPDSWEPRERTVLDDCLRPWRVTYPTVRVRALLTGTPTEIALEQASEDAAMLVLGCRRPDDSFRSRLGPIASWVTHHYRCPVVLVGHSGRVTEPVAGESLVPAAGA